MLSHLAVLLEPLARLCIRKGLTCPDTIDPMKLAFLAAARAEAEAEGAGAGRGATDSRLSVMTGLQRRDIQRLAALPRVPPVRAPGHLARLVHLWRTDPAYLGRDLPRHGPAPSFDALARIVRRDVHPRTLADQLVADGTVTPCDDDRLRLQDEAHLPRPGSAAQLDWLVANVGDHLRAAVANVLAEGPPRPERAVRLNGLSPAAVAELEQLWRDLGMAALRAIAERGETLQDRAPGKARFSAGLWTARDGDEGEQR